MHSESQIGVIKPNQLPVANLHGAVPLGCTRERDIRSLLRDQLTIGYGERILYSRPEK